MAIGMRFGRHALLVTVTIVLPSAVLGCTLLVSTSGLSDGNGSTPTGDGGSLADVGANDARADGSTDAPTTPPTCDLTKPFGPLTRFASPVTTNGNEYAGSLSQDLLQFVYARDEDLYGVVRASRDVPWSVPIPLNTINTAAKETNPSLPPSYLTLVFDSPRGGPSEKGSNLWIARRTSLLSVFDGPSPIEGVNSESEDIEPWLSPTEERLYFASDRLSGLDIYVATKNGPTSYDAPKLIDEITGPGGNEAPVLTGDELTMYFASNRPGSKDGSQDVWVATRSSITAKFGTPVALSDLNSNKDDYPTWVSADGCRIVVQSYVSGNSDLYLAERPK